MKDGIDTPRSGYAEVLDRVADRAAAAVVAKGRVRSVALRAALSARLRAEPGQADGFLADPVFEAARVWKRADRTLDDLAGSLLEEALVAALDGAPNRRWPRHGAEHAPYLHQMRAWTAAAEGRSFLVTSGTGSGKALQNLVRGTVLEDNAAVTLRAADAFDRMRERWMAEYGQLLTAQAAHPVRDPAHGFYMRRAKRMREEFMISELARRGFTPAYGFPVDVVAFDHVGRTGGEGGPSRPLDMAIRDYSPGAEVVIDGLVHRSDGILPTWGNRSEPGSVEDLRTLWRCPSCNAFGLSRLPVETCPDCGSGTRRGELLRPSGFLGTSKPHAAYETLAFVPPDRARVSAAGAPWVSLSDSATGALRTSREGKVLVTSSGPGGAGYAICIACGRAEAETGEDSEALPAGMTPLPAIAYNAVLTVERRVNKDGMVSVGGNLYSVPDTTRRRTLEVRQTPSSFSQRVQRHSELRVVGLPVRGETRDVETRAVAILLRHPAHLAHLAHQIVPSCRQQGRTFMRHDALRGLAPVSADTQAVAV